MADVGVCRSGKGVCTSDKRSSLLAPEEKEQPKDATKLRYIWEWEGITLIGIQAMLSCDGHILRLDEGTKMTRR